MEIRREVIKKLFNTFRERREQIIRGWVKGFTVLEGTGKEKIVTIKLNNGQGWYAIVCLYDTPELMVDVYDMHVFDRFGERFLKKEVDENTISEFIRRGNYEGTMLIEDGRFKRRIKDGATLGSVADGIIYHKTYITDDMIRENGMDYLFELC